jgi:acyl carrier protein
MTDQEIQQIILDIIEVVAPDADVSDIKPDVRLRDQLELDSMDFLDIVMELRKRHKVEVPKEDYQELASLDSCVTYLKPRLEAVAAG